jgi:hypothetical protein
MQILKRLRAWLGFEDQDAQIEALVSALEVQSHTITNFSAANRAAQNQMEEFYSDAYWHLPQELVDKWKERLGCPVTLKPLDRKAWDPWWEESCKAAQADPRPSVP